MLGEMIFGDTTSRRMAVEKEHDLNNFEGGMSALAPESSMDSVSVRAAAPRPSMGPISVRAAAPESSMDPISMHAIVQGPRIGAEKPVICADIRSMDEFGLESVHHVTDEPPSRPSPAFANTS